MRLLCGLCALWLPLLTGLPTPPAADLPGASTLMRSRISIHPSDARVFQGDSLHFHSALVSSKDVAPIRWSLIGPGKLDQSGLYSAPSDRLGTAQITAAADATAASVSVGVARPPLPSTRLAVVSCYDEGTLDVRGADKLASFGQLSTGDRAGGIAVDAVRRLGLVAMQGRVIAIDLRGMRPHPSREVPGARFSQIALLAGGYFVATDNNAQDGKPGVRLYRIGADGTPILGGSLIAGDTPEGISVSAGGREFYISNVNSNSIMRFTFDGRGHASMSRFVKTGTRPFGLAQDSAHNLLFVADNDTPAVSGNQSQPGLETFSLPALRRVRQVVRTGSQNALPLGVAVDPRARRLFVTNEGDATIAVFALPAVRQIATMPTGPTPWIPTIEPERHRLYVPIARANSVQVFDTRRLRPVGPAVTTCGYPTAIALVEPR